METTPEIWIDPSPPSDPPPEVHGDVSSKGILTDEDSEDGHQPTEGNKEFHVDVSSEDKATGNVADEEGISEGPETNLYGLLTTLYEDFLNQGGRNKKAFEVTPTIVVDEGYRRLFIAAARGYRKRMERELRGKFKSITATVMTVQNEPYSVLDIAVMFAHDELVEEMVKQLPKNYDVNILKVALFNAVRTGRINKVKALHCAIAGKVGADSETIERALHKATQYAFKQKEVVSYLAECIESAPKYETMQCLIMAGHLDIALSLAERFHKSISFKETKILSLLAKMKSYFGGAPKFKFWEKCIYKCIYLCLGDASNDNVEDTKKAGVVALAFKRFKKSLWNLAIKSAPRIKSFGESHLRHQGSCHLAFEALWTMECDMESRQIVESLLTSGIVLDAASRGIFEIVSLCLDFYPELMWEKEFTKKLIEEIVHRRHVDLFRLVKAFETIPYLTEDELTRHLMETLVASEPGSESTDVSGAAFLLQREIQWFEVLENRSHPSLKSLEFKVSQSDSPSKSLELEAVTESRGKTFWEVFVEERQGLLQDAGRWMKDTSSSCSLVATLIITMAFTAAFTVPGGNEESTGIPIMLKRGSFMIFAVADALALFSSVTATLMFLAILTSRYSVEDFRYSLPRKMILGLTFLFLSLAFMLVAFSSALTIVLSEKYKWIYIPIISLAALPVVLFAVLQLPLYVEMVKSTFRPRLFRPLN